MGSRSKERRQRAAARARERQNSDAKVFHPEPTFAAVCVAHGMEYSQDSIESENEWFEREGWPPQPYWVSPEGNTYQWDLETETYVPIESIPIGYDLRQVDGYGTDNVPGGWGGERPEGISAPPLVMDFTAPTGHRASEGAVNEWSGPPRTPTEG